MTEDVIRSVASNISLISVTLLAVTFVLLSLNWKGVTQWFLKLKTDEIKIIIRKSFITIIPLLLVLLIVNVIGIKAYDKYHFQASLFNIMLVLVIIIILYFAIDYLIKSISSLIHIFKRREKLDLSKVNSEINKEAYNYALSLLILALSIFCSVFALFFSIVLTLDISVIPTDLEDYNTIKWILLDAIVFFTIGIIVTAYTHLYSNTAIWKDKTREK